MFPPLRESTRDPALMRIQMEVPSSLEKATISGFATNPTRTFFANALKPDRNHGFTFLQPLG